MSQTTIKDPSRRKKVDRLVRYDDMARGLTAAARASLPELTAYCMMDNFAASLKESIRYRDPFAGMESLATGRGLQAAARAAMPELGASTMTGASAARKLADSIGSSHVASELMAMQKSTVASHKIFDPAEAMLPWIKNAHKLPEPFASIRGLVNEGAFARSAELLPRHLLHKGLSAGSLTADHYASIMRAASLTPAEAMLPWIKNAHELAEPFASIRGLVNESAFARSAELLPRHLLDKGLSQGSLAADHYASIMCAASLTPAEIRWVPTPELALFSNLHGFIELGLNDLRAELESVELLCASPAVPDSIQILASRVRRRFEKCAKKHEDFNAVPIYHLKGPTPTSAALIDELWQMPAVLRQLAVLLDQIVADLLDR